MRGDFRRTRDDFGQRLIKRGVGGLGAGARVTEALAWAVQARGAALPARVSRAGLRARFDGGDEVWKVAR